MIPRREMGNVWIKWIIETLCTGKSIYRSQKEMYLQQRWDTL